MHGGYHVDVSQRVQIDFECAESENDAPKLSVVRNGTHVLTWATRHACAQVYQTLFQDDGASDSPPEDDDEPANQDLVSLPDRNGPFVATIIVCSSAALFGLGYLVIRPPDVLRRHIRRTLFQRDTREAKLLRWATEEFEMLGIDEFEEDEMVNSHPLPDEQIPLRPNHIYSPFVDYGTVR
ncbi:hypothetical protein F5148DRAFT_155221 [Russula earlei]|uniref:Uncharacterized protein n=1 Tax=Russula earlei TaxID=71964 RepID=A0ACC0UJT9_9AGAM|nr:hypothetical protein F5148DRAFT_155221 [Russula earlei]